MSCQSPGKHLGQLRMDQALTTSHLYMSRKTQRRTVILVQREKQRALMESLGRSVLELLADTGTELLAS